MREDGREFYETSQMEFLQYIQAQRDAAKQRGSARCDKFYTRYNCKNNCKNRKDRDQKKHSSDGKEDER